MSGLWRQSGRTPVGPPTDRPPGTDGCLLACLLASVCAPTHLYLSSNPPLPLFVCMYVCAYRSVGRREGVGCDFAGWATCSRSSPRSLCRPTCARAPYTHARLRTYSPSQYSPRQAPVSQSGRQLHYPLQAGRDGRTDGGREPGRGRKAVRVVSTLRGCTARPDRRLRTYVLQSPVSRADRLWADRAESLAIHTSARAGGRPTS